MDFAAPHVGFVVAAYGVSAAVIAGLVAAVFARHRRTLRHLSELEAKGGPRRRPAGPRP